MTRRRVDGVEVRTVHAGTGLVGTETRSAQARQVRGRLREEEEKKEEEARVVRRPRRRHAALIGPRDPSPPRAAGKRRGVVSQSPPSRSRFCELMTAAVRQCEECRGRSGFLAHAAVLRARALDRRFADSDIPCRSRKGVP